MYKLASPGSIGSQHDVKYGEELTHARDDGNFLRFARSQKPLVELLDDRIEACRADGCHVERRTDAGTTTPNHPFAAARTAVSAKWADPHERADLAAIELSELRQLG